jgi:hypothetical protein
MKFAGTNKFISRLGSVFGGKFEIFFGFRGVPISKVETVYPFSVNFISQDHNLLSGPFQKRKETFVLFSFIFILFS